MRVFSTVLTAVMVLYISACSVNPVTGEKELTLMSAAQEVAIGEEKYGPYLQQQGGRYTVDPELNLYVNQVGQQLAKLSQRPQLPYEFVVLNSGAPNAWALPGGKIAINRGLILLLDDEAQLAAVLSHEIVHAAARHAARQMTQAALMNVGIQATGLAVQNSDYGQWIAAGAGLGANLWQAHYGRDQELEADKFGVQYMALAGYDTEAAVELQEKLMALSQGSQKSWFSDLLASHPPSQERIARNRQYAQQYGGGDRNSKVFLKATAQLRRDQAAYESYQQTVAAASKNDIAAALVNVKQAIAKQPKEALFHITRGQLLMSQHHDADALLAFKKGRDLNPEYYLGHLGMGLLLKQEKQNSAALTALSKSMALLPSTLAAYHLGELQLAAGNREQAIQYFEFAAQGQGDIAEAARAQLSKLAPPVAPVSSSAN